MTALRDPAQPMAALQLANKTRRRVHEYKQGLAALHYRTALATVAITIEHDHDDRLLGAAKVRHLLQCVQGIGEHRAAKMMHASEIHSPEKKLRELTERQRWLLIGVVESVSASWRERQR